MRKFLSVLITTALLLGFGACGGSDNSTTNNASTESPVQSTESGENSVPQEQSAADSSANGSTDGNTAVSSDVTVSKDDGENSSVMSDSSEENSENATNNSSAVADSQDNSGNATEPELPVSDVYTVNVTKNSDGTYTVTATLPEKAESGKIIISTSDKLTLVKGSLSTEIQSGLTNESYKRNGVVGAAVAFASVVPLEKGTVAYKATYTVAEGAVISDGDVSVPEWNLSSGGKSLGNNTTATIKVNYVF